MPPELSETPTVPDHAAPDRTVTDGAAEDGATPDGAAAPAPKGRPRSEAVSQAILEAALDLIAEHENTTDVSVEAIAERSGVSKASIYRRWSSKEEIIAAAMECIKAPLPAEMPRTSLRDDLVHLGHSMVRTYGERDTKVLRCMMVAMKDPEYKRHHDRLVERRRRFVRDTLAYWAERGQVRPDLDLHLAVAMIVSPMLTIYVYGHYAELQAPDTVEQIVDALVGGIGTALASG
ncbi:TetR/AcrR family transcriptional regulator C-terminal ligand-binding domain-containing protein [Glycomyces tritici]|uniref:TetR/AcrR family transcriptional regulator C-terminal ligand-binding domain-containing protein n=1 Tax=Glycomyces tritici TaxID=2665176 RepID=A0ABT7YP09_9ACTN|nr:TetR/AcrR family transcriptional regulator C-terminal ligand-binding domain-containing protein [Glycomyces tritici]MDN3240382.1 TetR/AcrR family transcriptional regulator C-terminal ligand-binding domain-containing protein [Glycomyces tritici]